MVRVGNFTVRLVSAETKDPFKEHTAPDGKTIYVEAEPDAEYFIECVYEKSGGDDDVDGSDVDVDDEPKMVLLNFVVDGKELGYQNRISKEDGAYHAGIWSYENGSSKMKAFSFHIPDQFTGVSSNTGVDVSAMMFGSVAVKFFEALPDGILIRDEYTADSIKSSPIKGKAEKALRSGVGTTSESRRISRVSTSYKNGKLLQTIHLNYCTAVGLIYAKILPTPDVWTWAKMKNPIDTAASEIIPVKPKRIQRNGVVIDGKVIEPPTECDFFDLTVLPDEDGEENEKEGDTEEDEVSDEDEAPLDVFPDEDSDDEEEEDKAVADGKPTEDKTVEDEEVVDDKTDEGEEEADDKVVEDEGDGNQLIGNGERGSLALGDNEDLESLGGKEEVKKIVVDKWDYGHDSDSEADDE